jgi:hypothetical protein
LLCFISVLFIPRSWGTLLYSLEFATLDDFRKD